MIAGIVLFHLGLAQNFETLAMESSNPLFQTQNLFQTTRQFESEGLAMQCDIFDACFINKS